MSQDSLNDLEQASKQLQNGRNGASMLEGRPRVPPPHPPPLSAPRLAQSSLHLFTLPPVRAASILLDIFQDSLIHLQ